MFGRMRQTTGWETPGKRSIEANLFVFVIDGDATFHIEDKAFFVRNGDILVIPANTEYSARTERFCEYFFFHFSGNIAKAEKTPDFVPAERRFSFSLEPCRHDYIYFALKNDDESAFEKIYASVVNCVGYRAGFTKTDRLLLDAEFFKILLTLGGIEESKRAKLPVQVEKMITYIRKNLTKPLSLRDVAENCALSEAYASRLFRRHMEMTVTDFIGGEKLYYACELLKNTNMNVSEIAEYLGYRDVYYFSRSFKKKTGTPPSALKP